MRKHAGLPVGEAGAADGIWQAVLPVSERLKLKAVRLSRGPGGRTVKYLDRLHSSELRRRRHALRRPRSQENSVLVVRVRREHRGRREEIDYLNAGLYECNRATEGPPPNIKKQGIRNGKGQKRKGRKTAEDYGAGGDCFGRHAELMILRGQVRVNGHVVQELWTRRTRLRTGCGGRDES